MTNQRKEGCNDEQNHDLAVLARFQKATLLWHVGRIVGLQPSHRIRRSGERRLHRCLDRCDTERQPECMGTTAVKWAFQGRFEGLEVDG